MPVQDRSRVKVDRILLAAAAILADETAPATLRALATRAGVSLGTVYQYFENMDAVRAAVGERARRLLADALAAEVPADFGAEPERFFAALIGCVDRLQQAHPELGCMVRDGPRSPFVAALAAELRGVVLLHLSAAPAARLASDPLDAATRIRMAVSLLVALLGQAPTRDDGQRDAYLARVALLAGAAVQGSG